MKLLHGIARAFGPVVARPKLAEILRAATGAGVGLLTTGLLARHLPGSGAEAMPFLVAPLGATAFLLFAVPNSPLAQPWSAIVGNTLSALLALCVIRLFPDVRVAAPLSVAGAVLLMTAARAMHPPGGAVALLIALNARPDNPTGFDFALAPVFLDTFLLVLLAIAFNRATGRKYPFRQPPEESPHGTRDTRPDRRLGLSADDLATILSQMNLAANIGTEDLARLIGAAEAEATSRHLGGLTAGEVMSHDLVTVAPDLAVDALADLFRARRFKSLPVATADGRYLGLVTQTDLLGRPDRRLEAGQILSNEYHTVTPKTPLAPLLALLADGAQQSVPVLEDGQLRGLVTRTDMIGALAHALRG